MRWPSISNRIKSAEFLPQRALNLWVKPSSDDSVNVPLLSIKPGADSH